MKETIKYIDETEVELNIYSLPFRKSLQLIDNYLPLSELKQDDKGNAVIPDSYDKKKIFLLMEECVKTIKDIDIEKISGQEVGRLYKKYFEKDLMMGMGKGGNPN